MDLFETKSGVLWVFLEGSISLASLFLDLSGQGGEEFPETLRRA